MIFTFIGCSAQPRLPGQVYLDVLGHSKADGWSPAKVDLSGVEDQIFDLVYSLSDDGSIEMINKEIVVAIRSADFTVSLKKANVVPENNPVNLQDELIKTNKAIAAVNVTSAAWVLFSALAGAGI